MKTFHIKGRIKVKKKYKNYLDILLGQIQKWKALTCLHTVKVNCLVRGEHLCNLMIKDLAHFFFANSTTISL